MLHHSAEPLFALFPPDRMRRFFAGVSKEKMQSILHQAFNQAPSGTDRVQKYMALLDGVLV